MRIIIDIGHPAHVHYFKNLIKILKSNGNKILVIARDKEVTFDLLNAYKIDYLSRGNGGSSYFGKGISLIYAVLKVFLFH